MIVIVIIADYAHSPNSYKRHLFIEICLIVMELFSSAFYKEYFFETTLELVNDKVPNIRLRFCSLVPRLKEIIMWHANSSHNLGRKLEDSIRKLMVHETDKDVRFFLGKVTLQHTLCSSHLENIIKLLGYSGCLDNIEVT